MFLHIAVGATLSCTVTVEVQVDILPLLSVTVKITVFAPTLEHVNVFGDTVIFFIPQASLEPLSICEAIILALPVASNCTVKFLHIAVGATLSCTVTVEVQVDILPLLSVTVRVTALVPILVHVNVFGDTVMLFIPQASLEPLSICEAVIEA